MTGMCSPGGDFINVADCSDFLGWGTSGTHFRLHLSLSLCGLIYTQIGVCVYICVC